MSSLTRNLPTVVAIAAITVSIAYYIGQSEEFDIGFSIDYKDRESVRLGKELYVSNCASCHGANLEGQTPDWRQRNADGSLPAPPHDETGHTWHHPDEILYTIVRDGGMSDPASGFVSNMPAYGNDLSKQEIHDILAFIKSSWPEAIQRRHDAMNAQLK